MERETGETCGTSETGHTRAELNSLPASAFSEAAGVVSTARIERPPLCREGSACTETIPVFSPSLSEFVRFVKNCDSLAEEGLDLLKEQ